MKIPDNAIIAEEKLTKYLLVVKEVDDKSKFLAQAGFRLDNWKDLESAIRNLISTEEAVFDRTNEYGNFYNVSGKLIGSEGQVTVITVWIIGKTEELFRFVTLKPQRHLE